MACSKSSKTTGDFFGNAPDIVIDKILESLPISMAVQTSVLSKRWRWAWLSLKSLIFGLDFWKELTSKDEYYDLQKFSQIISNILLHHRGSVHDFYVYIPAIQDINRDCANHSQWISFLSNNGVRKITMINNWLTKKDITSYIFWCRELVGLELKGFCFCPPPTDFNGFPNLKHLVLEDIHFKQNIFSSLIENCRMLETLKLVGWSGMDQIVIDAPTLQTLILNGHFESLAFRNIRSLRSISMGLKIMPNKLVTVATIDVVNLLATSCQLQFIQFDGHLCKLFAAGGNIRSSSVTFNNLNELCLSNLCLSEFGTLRDLLSLIECCPHIKKLDISVISGENVGQHIPDFNYNYKLDHLREVYIKGIIGSIAELKFVEYLLAISPILENLFFKSGEFRVDSELKMSRALMGFPRASTKARLLVTSGKNVGQNIDDFNYNYKLDHLHEVSIKGITGSSAELKLVEYLLAISPVLENMFFYSDKLGIELEQKMLRALMGFPRASPKARLLFLEK
ncbi:F-box/FBD/LRR-repeat protein At1g13570-like [Silene latifolia]|uniref:F-box/FBD/LRR-repeat protein At1g13570-like n=1 Tax=Silene latifolia TaxID=37657 RepID=UPI003D785047